MLALPALALAQGQDSLPAERDLMIVAAMLPGHYVNANQVYFDSRRALAPERRHAPLEWRIETTDDPLVFAVTMNSAETATLELSVDTAADQVLMRMTLADGAVCRYAWARRAGQYDALAQADDCASPLPQALELADAQLRVNPGAGDAIVAASPYALNRARSFICHADVPGVGGGRDIPYQRYGQFTLHDQGGAAWFTTDDTPPRRLGLSLLLVDWPINNYAGLYARDSLVIYVSEDTGDGRIEHGYAFTVPDADRIGINLKWLLGMCYRVPNAAATPEF